MRASRAALRGGKAAQACAAAAVRHAVAARSAGAGRSLWKTLGAAAAGSAGFAFVAWPVVDGNMMPAVVRLAMRPPPRPAPAAAGGAAPGGGELSAQLRGGGGVWLVTHDDGGGRAATAATLAAAGGRPCMLLDCNGVSDARVLTWATLHQLLTPLGAGGTLISSYAKAVYMAAALFTGNQSHEHLNIMFYFAFLDWLSAALRTSRGAPADQRPVVVLANAGSLLRQAERAAADGDAERRRHLLTSTSALFNVAQHLAAEGTADWVVTADAGAADLLAARPEFRGAGRGAHVGAHPPALLAADA